jgi:TolA-binding protein
MFASTPKGDANRSQLARRLGDAYLELESVARRDAGAAQGAEQEKARKIEEAARQSLIKYYTLVLNEYPAYPSGDELTYSLGRAYERVGKTDDARKTYYKLLKNWPASKYVPNVYLAFGELFFKEAQSDPERLTIAVEAYGEVLNFPKSDAVPAALFRLGQTHERKGDRAKARVHFKKLVSSHSSSPLVAFVPDWAR